MKKLIAILLAVMMVITIFVACGKKDDDDEDETGSKIKSGEKTESVEKQPSGKYVAKTINGKKPIDYFTEELGEEMDDFIDFYEIDEKKLNTDFMTMDFNKDGTVTITGIMVEMDDEESYDGTWELDGTDLAITINGKSADFKFEKGKITGSPSEGVEIVYEKNK